MLSLTAMQRWHPDKIAGGRVDPTRAEEAKSRFQQIHEAYQGKASKPTNLSHSLSPVGAEPMRWTFGLHLSRLLTTPSSPPFGCVARSAVG